MAHSGAAMKGLVEIISNVTNLIRFALMLMFLCIFGFGLLLTFGASYVAPKAVESLAERAEQVTQKAIEAEQLEARNRAYAPHGWGYSDDAVEARAEADQMASELEEDITGWEE